MVTIISSFLIGGCNKNNNEFYDVQYSKQISSLNENPSAVEIAENVKPAIVGIVSKKGSASSIGSGVCVKSGGYVLTNYHVIQNSGEITFYLSDGSIAKGITLYKDSNMDIAIIKSNKAIPFLTLGNSDNLKVGEDVLAVGTPMSLSFKHSFTKGIVSATNRTLKVPNAKNEIGIMNNLIQHDASINPGNSGGPLINNKSELIGINTLKINNAEGLGFAIPIKSVLSIIKKVGISKVRNPFLGIVGYDADIIDVNKKGFYVYDVLKNSNAYNYGIKSGDIITKINGVSINNGTDFRYELFKYNDDDVIIVNYISNNDEKKTLITLECNNKH